MCDNKSHLGNKPSLGGVVIANFNDMTAMVCSQAHLAIPLAQVYVLLINAKSRLNLLQPSENNKCFFSITYELTGTNNLCNCWNIKNLFILIA